MAKKGPVDETDENKNELTIFEDRLISLLALMLVQERKQAEQIDLLARAGFRSIEIADLIGTTRNTVSVQLSNQRKGKQSKQGKKAKE